MITMKGDMTSGNPGRTLVKFAIPVVLGNLFQQAYNLADTMIVGKKVGANALAAVGTCSSITFLFIAIATGAGIGASVVISQYFGAGKFGKMRSAIRTVMLTMLAISSFITVLGLLLHRSILRAMNTPPEVFEDAAIYLSIYFMGVIFLFLFNTLNAIFNALGNSKVPLLFLAFSSILNIVLDLVFVINFGLGVAGVAYATLIAQALSAVLSFLALLIYMKKLKVQEESRYFDLEILKTVANIAVPSIIQQSIVSIGIVLVQALVNRYGPDVMAGYAAATKIDSVAIMPMVNIGSAMSTFTAQNIGAKKPERVAKGLRGALSMVWIFGLFIAGILYLYGEQFIGFFIETGASEKVMEVGIEYLKVVSVFYVIMGTMNNFNGVLRGAGDMKVFMIATLCNLSVRVVLAYGLATLSGIGYHAIWWSIPIGWTVALIVAYVRYASGRWKNVRTV